MSVEPIEQQRDRLVALLQSQDARQSVAELLKNRWPTAQKPRSYREAASDWHNAISELEQAIKQAQTTADCQQLEQRIRAFRHSIPSIRTSRKVRP